LKKAVFPFIFLLFIFGCSTDYNYESEGPFITVSSASAGEIEINEHFNVNYSVYENGDLHLYSTERDDPYIGNDAPVFKTKISNEEVEQIKSLLEKYNFHKMKNDLSVDSEDGSFLYVTVYLEDESKKVGGLNPDDEQFLSIIEYVRGLVKSDDRSAWYEEIREYIEENNPY